MVSTATTCWRSRSSRVSLRPQQQRRNVVTSSACGICGATSIEQVMRESPYAVDPESRVEAGLILSAPTLLRQYQRAFDQTGGLHAAGLLGLDSSMVCVREDVGRHNAVDKVIGWAIREQLLPLRRMILTVSGRASFELTQKAVLAGIPVLAAVSAPSSLAAELAEEAGLTLVGFVRRRDHECLHTSAAASLARRTANLDCKHDHAAPVPAAAINGFRGCGCQQSVINSCLRTPTVE